MDFNTENFTQNQTTKKKQKQGFFMKFNILLQSLQGVKLIDKVFFSRDLAFILRAGMPLSKALLILRKQAKKAYFKKIIYCLKKDIEKGLSFTEALKKHPKVFDETYVNLVNTGEVGGNMERVLDELSVYLKKEYDFRKKLIGAMIYPVIILVFMVLLCILMLAFILPRLSKLFIEMGVELPLITKILIQASFFMQKFYYLVILGFAGIIVAFWRLKKVEKIKQKFYPLLLYVPVVNNLIRKIQIARFTRSASSLLKSGLSIILVLKVTAKANTNVLYKNALLDVVDKVKKGDGIGVSLEQYAKLFPAMVVQMTQVGEETGNLSEIWEKLADFYEEEVDQLVKNLSTIIEPFLMILMGVGVGFLAISFLMPIYSFISQIE